jgi:hypothetical protein
MKTKTSIYHHTFAFAYVLLVAVIFCGCGNETPKQELTHIDKIYPIIDKIEAVDGNGIRNVRLYVIDSCEYIGHINAFNSDFLTHKGNCKFCTERSKK